MRRGALLVGLGIVVLLALGVSAVLAPGSAPPSAPDEPPEIVDATEPTEPVEPPPQVRPVDDVDDVDHITTTEAREERSTPAGVTGSPSAPEEIVPSESPPLSVLGQKLEGTSILGFHLMRRFDATELLAHPDAMRTHIRTGLGTLHQFTAEDGRAIVDLGPCVGEDTVLEFGPGTFHLVWGDWFDHTREIRSLEIRGAGMDRTTLVGPEPFLLHTGDRTLPHVAVRDLTLDAAGGSTRIDVHGGLSLALDRVRFRGWSSTGYCAPIGVSSGGGVFVVARDCEFLGQGRSHDYAISLRGDGLVSFARCRFLSLSSAITGSGGEKRAARVFIQDSTFHRARLGGSLSSPPDSGGVAVVVRGGRVSFGPGQRDPAELRRLWRADRAESVEGTAFGPPPRPRPRRRR